jgi:hypothetical protein
VEFLNLSILLETVLYLFVQRFSITRALVVTEMPALKNIRRERFAQLLAGGQRHQDRASREQSVPTREREIGDEIGPLLFVANGDAAYAGVGRSSFISS